MADRGAKRASADSEESSNKKTKMDGKANPYLAHMYEEENGWGSGEPSPNSPLAGMKRRQTSAQEASKAEDSDSNPFTGRQHSQKYFQILQTRRDLPVHKQRFVPPFTMHRFSLRSLTSHLLGKNSSTSIIRPRSSSSSERLVPERPHRSPSTSCTMSCRISMASLLPARSRVESLPCQ